MDNSSVTILCRITPEVFRAFGMFDTFRRQKRWRSPAIFAAILVTSAALCYSFIGKTQHAALLGTVLLVIGLGLPAAYFINFSRSITAQSKKMGLEQGRSAYTVRLDGEGMSAENGPEKANWAWGDMAYVYRLDQCICLYPTPRQAFIIPDLGEDKDPERAWKLVTASLPPEKVFDLRG